MPIKTNSSAPPVIDKPQIDDRPSESRQTGSPPFRPRFQTALSFGCPQ
ncbi:hypothetical protein NEIELOOT_02012 [Neisseria elongata subsp. glycolytica ATCC 29315]|uniref:Uncharacterized protein n=1 Tax=Neisseria elongata subsp. glycolytica ATCC 29315 TaxID=546263 RepID=D4DSG7_NEIEG|nr:hypothetical protein NEIELOOT_02012 [Neisseria elongata subsp. glycolytica ATCC 29315]